MLHVLNKLTLKDLSVTTMPVVAFLDNALFLDHATK